MRLSDRFKPVPLDLDALYDEAERAGRYGECPMCELRGDARVRVLCRCGVCFDCHDRFVHEPIEEREGP